MPEMYPRELEVQRVVNLISGFGWEKIKEELVGKDLVLTIKKTILSDEDLESPPVPS